MSQNKNCIGKGNFTDIGTFFKSYTIVLNTVVLNKWHIICFYGDKEKSTHALFQTDNKKCVFGKKFDIIDPV